ncbi:MAG: penicillin-binding transpeptidase domain-containing protein [Longimicrobiales bacterium]|nr:penicillin-binding transpeptidase domain-containing protein [Longimicrobiales bacterium]
MSPRRRGSRPRPWRRRAVLSGWLLAALVVTVRAAQIQVVQASEWRSVAGRQHQEDQRLAAPRGTIRDRSGNPMSVTRERALVNVAPREVRDAAALEVRLAKALGVSSSRAARLVRSGRGWNAAGTHPPAVRGALEGFPGVYVERVYERWYPHDDLARGVLGVVIDQEGKGGVEREFESWLAGKPGRQVVARDNVGNPIPGERITVQPPRAGGEVVLTLDMNLQEIAQTALLEAIEEHQAQGGDVLITNPRTGEVLALFSIQNGHPGALSAVNTSFEPGSTLKPFTVAGLLKHDLASLNDSVDVGEGVWEVAGRRLHDTHTEGVMTIREALRESSNVGIAKAAAPMSPGVQYENLRDFGFGTLTGVELPGEVAGTLRRPDDWSGQSAASLAIGYEIAVTPLQMAMAYGALANGGLLLRPRLVKELRDANGMVVETFEPEVVRRVLDRRSAQALGRALVDVVEDGTGKLARLGSFRVAGKSGTARVSSGGRYEAGAYSSSFVGYFPADAPQLVVFVKLDRPQAGEYYGGAVAAPVTRATMEAALAANSLNLGELVASTRDQPGRIPTDLTPVFAALPLEPALPPLDLAAGRRGASAGRSAPAGVSVPDVSGLPARIAVRHLHRFGLRVARVGTGQVTRTIPAAGARVTPGDTIRLRYGERTNE